MNQAISFYGGTDIGRVRQKNEDSILCCEFEHSDVCLLVVADGVGGHAGGDIASKLAVDTMQETVAKAILQANSGGGYAENWLQLTLKHAVEEANNAILKQQTEQAELRQMATTVVAMLVRPQVVALSYLGDSRCYQYVDDLFVQITEDHTMLQQMLNDGMIDQQEFDSLPLHHMISQALGLTNHPQVKVNVVDFPENAMFLLCSDGLTNCVSDAQIEHVLSSSEDLTSCVDQLITHANDNGGVDNISVIVVRKYN